MPIIDENILAEIENNRYLTSPITKKWKYPWSPSSTLELANEDKSKEGISSENAIKLLFALRNNTEITKLKFYFGFIFTSSFCDEFIHLLNNNNVIKKLAFSHLYDPINVVPVLQALENLNDTITLSFSMRLTQQVIDQIAILLDKNKIKELKLNFCELQENATLDCLLKAIKTNTSLTKLKINSNRINQNLPLLIDVVERNQNIETLSLKHGLWIDSFTQLCQSLQKNKVLKHLVIGFTSPQNFKKSPRQAANSLFSRTREPLQTIIANLATLVSADFYLNVPSHYCRHEEAKSSCKFCTHENIITDDDIEKQINQSLVAKRLKEIQNVKLLCQTLLDKVIKYGRKEISNLNELELEQIYEQVNSVIENVNKSSFDVASAVKEPLSKIKDMQLEIFCRVQDTENALNFYKKNYECDNATRKGHAYFMIANMFMLSAENMSSKDEYDDVNLQACAFYVWAASLGDKESINIFKTLLERMIRGTFTQVGFDELVKNPLFIEKIWPKLIAKIDVIDSSLSSESLKPFCATVDKSFNDISLFCQYLVNENKRLVLSNELWRLNAIHRHNQTKELKRKVIEHFGNHSVFFKKARRNDEQDDALLTNYPPGLLY